MALRIMVKGYRYFSFFIVHCSVPAKKAAPQQCLNKFIIAFGLLFFSLFIVTLLVPTRSAGQELNCTVKLIHSQIQGTNTSVFETLETAIREFMNNREWTDLQFGREEKIDCTMTLTLSKYVPNENSFSGELLVQCSRPVFNSMYNSVVFTTRDQHVNFTYKEYDPLEFNETSMDNNLTAILAYYAYLFIGMDLDTFSKKGGTDVLHRVETIVNNAQTFSDPGWKAFDDSKNRHAIINDYMDSQMEPFREMMYVYHRQGLDEMANNVDRGRGNVTDAIQLLKTAAGNKPMSSLPQIFTDYKRDERVGIYQGHGTEKEKTSVCETLTNLNAAQSSEWNKIKK